MTEDGIFSPTRVPQGAMDSVLHFQAQLQRALSQFLFRHCLIWIDDIILFDEDDDSYLGTLRVFFDILRKHNLKLSAAKSKVYCKEVTWCGKLTSGKTVRHDPDRLLALSSMPLPSTIQELQHFLCAVGWLRDSLPDYARLSLSLQSKFDTMLKSLGRRNKNGLKMAVELSPDEVACFDAVKVQVSAAVPLHFPTDDGEMCLFTDASMEGWSVIVTKVDDWKADIPVHKQQHRLLVCKGGAFAGSEKNWSIIEKEAFPIVKACCDLEYLLLRKSGFRMYCDHRNLIFVFSPSLELKQHVRDKLQRWAMRICGLKYTIERIEGRHNVWANVITRWAAPRVASIRVLAVRTRSNQPPSPTRPISNPDFSFPSLMDLKLAQSKYRGLLRQLSKAREDSDGLICVDDKPWIPPKSTGLLTRIMVVAHCGARGHHGQDAMVQVLAERLFVERLVTKVQQFLRECLLCKHVKGPFIQQRPWGPTFATTRRNEALHWDYLFLGDGYGANSYVLVMKGALTRYCELFPCAVPTSLTSADGLLEWFKRYGSPEILISDQGSHFRNRTVELLCARLRTDRQFTPVYSPWINGTVERANKDLLQVLHALLIEYHLDTSQWPYLLPIVQASLNHTAVESLGGHAPIEIFLGLPKPSPFDMVTLPKHGVVDLVEVDLAAMTESVENLRLSLQCLHREVIDLKERKRLQRMASKKGSLCNFDVGDFVLWSRIDERLPNRKLLATWLGPFRVTEAKSHSFLIEHLLTKSQYEVRGSRLKFYHDASLEETEEIRELVSEQGIELGVEAIQGHRFNQDTDRWEVRIKWVGLEEHESSWEGLRDIHHDMPKHLHEYVSSTNDD